MELGRILASLSQFDIFLLGKLQHLYGNDSNGMRDKLLRYEFNYTELATQFCQNGSRCDIHQIKENIFNVVGQLLLMNGYVKCVTSISHSLFLIFHFSHNYQLNSARRRLW